ncbi:MAG: AzlD domain-containing protein [Clostridia bacterium]|nr:AzlD domain-containing protein [Clostridia bacterium]
MNDLHAWLTVAVIALVTAALRFLPFLVFRGDRETPRFIQKLGNLLPYAIMGMLVVYCLKDVRFTDLSGFLPQLIAVLIVTGTYLWRRNTLVSILSGTISYMILVQFVF